MGKQIDDYLNLMKRKIEEAFGDLCEKFYQKRCVLLDYPTHGNVGDHLIWLGEIEFLRKYLKIGAKSSSHVGDGAISILERCIRKEDIIFLHGGGNWGDLWPKHQLYREEVISHFKENKIIMFPQTIYFQDKENLVRSAARINQHPRLTIFVRDRISEAIAREYYTAADIRLCPDMAFYLDIPRNASKVVKGRSMVMMRKDKELNKAHRFQAAEGADVLDWDDISTNIDRFIIRAIGFSSRIISKGMRVSYKILPGFLLAGLYLLTGWLYWLKARVLVSRAVKTFERYEQITTTRMHGHILATLMRINNVLLPNSYHKNKAFFECWAEHNGCARLKE